MYHLYFPLQLIWANLKNTRQNQPTQTSSCDKKGKKPTIRKIQGETIQRKALAVTKRVKTRQYSRVRTQPMCSDNFSLKYFKDLLQPKTIKKQKTSLSLYTTLLHRLTEDEQVPAEVQRRSKQYYFGAVSKMYRSNFFIQDKKSEIQKNMEESAALWYKTHV